MATALMSPGVVGETGTTLARSANEPASAPSGDVLPRQQQNFAVIPIKLEGSGPYSALPTHVLFGALRHPALKLREPIPLRTERSDQGISVIWDEGQEFGFGDTFTDAAADFGETIAELYLQLCDNEALSDDLISIRDRLSHYIDVRPQ